MTNDGLELTNARAAGSQQEALLLGGDVSTRYRTTLADYTQAKLQQVDQLEEQLEQKILAQRDRLQLIEEPGRFALPGTRRAVQELRSRQEGRLQALEARLEAVREVREAMGTVATTRLEELAERCMRHRNPELAAEYDEARAARLRHELVTRDRGGRRGVVAQSLSLRAE